MKHVLVTGGAGYIGSHACKALADAGYTPVVYDNLSTGHRWAVKWGPFEAGNLLDRDRLKQVLARYRPEAVMHFAAFSQVGESVVEPAKYYRNNVFGTLCLLDAMRDCDIRQLVFSSTCAIYGMPEDVPIKEDHAKAPISPYGASKWMIERILQDYAAAYGLRSISLRYFNAAGADPAGQIGEYHTPETHLIPLVLDVAAGRRDAIRVFGSDYDTPDGTCIRDYIHVCDLASVHLLALKALEAGGQSRAYNLGNGNGYSVNEIIEASRQISGRPIASEAAPRREGDPPVLVGSAGSARRELGWRPRYDRLEDIIKTAWKWTLGRDAVTASSETDRA